MHFVGKIILLPNSFPVKIGQMIGYSEALVSIFSGVHWIVDISGQWSARVYC